MTPELVRWLMNSHTLDGPIGLDELVHRPQWMAFGACRDEPLVTYFPDRGGSTKRAHELCTTCVVKSDCLDYAMADEEIVGIWAGTSARDRARLRREAS